MIALLSALLSAFIFVGVFAVIGPLLHNLRIRIEVYVKAVILSIWQKVTAYWLTRKARKCPTVENIERAKNRRVHLQLRAINSYIDLLKGFGPVKVCHICGFPFPKDDPFCEYCHTRNNEPTGIWRELYEKYSNS